MDDKNDTILGVLARFENPAALLEAAQKMREAGYSRFDCHSPFPIHGMDQAMGLKRSVLGFIVAAVSFFAMIGGLALQWYANAYDYPIIVAGKPFFSYQSYAPVGFGITVFCAGFTTLIGMLALNGLPRLFHPVFYSRQFARATDDGFFISIETGDPQFEPEKSKLFLESIGGQNVETLKPNDNAQDS